MPNNIVFLFENAKQVTVNFSQAHLGPALVRARKLDETAMEPIDYLDRSRAGVPPREPSDVAREVSDKWDAGEYRRTVFVVDLDARGSDTTDRTFGLKVLRELSICLGFAGVERLLGHGDFLTVILTIYGHRIPEAIDATWGPLSRLDTVKRNDPATKGTLASRLRSLQPRLVLADRGQHDEWLAGLIAEWI